MSLPRKGSLSVIRMSKRDVSQPIKAHWTRLQVYSVIRLLLLLAEDLPERPYHATKSDLIACLNYPPTVFPSSTYQSSAQLPDKACNGDPLSGFPEMTSAERQPERSRDSDSDSALLPKQMAKNTEGRLYFEHGLNKKWSTVFDTETSMHHSLALSNHLLCQFTQPEHINGAQNDTALSLSAIPCAKFGSGRPALMIMRHGCRDAQCQCIGF